MDMTEVAEERRNMLSLSEELLDIPRESEELLGILCAPVKAHRT